MGRFIRLTVGTVSDVPSSEAVTDGLAVTDAASAVRSDVRSPTDAVAATDSVAAVLTAEGLLVGQGAAPLGSTAYTIPSDGTARFVSLSGSDSADGLTAATPWRTFAKAATAPAGSTIVMRGGVYEDEGATFTGTANNATRAYTAISFGQANITIQCYPGEAVWIDGSKLVTGWAASGSFWRASRTPMRRDLYQWESSYPPASNTFDSGNASTNWRKLDNDAVGWTYVNYDDSVMACAGWPDRVFRRLKGSTSDADWVELTQYRLLSETPAGDNFHWDVYGNYLYIGVDPAVYDIRVTSKQTLLNALGANFTMRGIGVRRYAPTMQQFGCIKLHRINATLENCILEDISSKAVSVLGSSTNTGTDATAANNALIDRCTFRKIGNTGIHHGETDGMIVRDSRFEYCNDKLFNPAPDAGAIKMHAGRNITIVRNLFLHTYRGKGIWTDVMVETIYTISNDFIDCEQRDAIYEMSRDVWHIGNRHIGTGAEPVAFMDTETAEVWNNTFYNTGVNRGVVMGADTVNSTGVAIFLDNRTPLEAGHISYYSARHNSGAAVWGGNNPGGWWPDSYRIRNNVFGPSNYECYFRLQTLGPDGTPSIARSWTADGLDINRNYYNGHASKQVLSRQYPWVLRTTPLGSNTIFATRSALAAGTTANPAGALEANGVEYTDVDRCNPTTGLLQTSYQTAADAVAAALPSTIAALLGVSTGTQRMGPLVRS